MSFAAAIANDWMMFDGLQDLEYFVRIDEVTYGGAVPTIGLKRMNIKSYELGGQQIEVSLNECVWEVWVTSFQSGTEDPPIPKRGDKFTADGPTGVKTWNILGVDYCTLLSRYRLHAKQEGNDS